MMQTVNRATSFYIFVLPEQEFSEEWKDMIKIVRMTLIGWSSNGKIYQSYLLKY